MTLADLRRAAILDHLKDTPDSIKGTAETLDLNYYTCRNDIHALKEEGRVFEANIYNKSTIVWQTMQPSVMPTVLVRSSNRVLRLDDYAHNYVASDRKPSSVTALHDYLICLVELVELARSYSQDNFPGGLSSNDATKPLRNVRKRLLHAETVLSNNLFVIKQLVNNTDLWNPMTLKEIVEDAKFDPDQARADFESLLQEGQESDGDSS